MTSKSFFITFFFQNIGIYFLYAIGLLFALGTVFSNPVDISLAAFSFIILITGIKIILTCYSIYSTKIINLLKEKPLFLIPILLFDFFLISLLGKLDFWLFGIVLSVTPCILIYYIFNRINHILNFPKIRLFIYFFAKIGIFFLGLLFLFFLLGLFVNPENINILLSLFLFFFVIVFISVFQNLFFYNICFRFKLFNENCKNIKIRLILLIIIDISIYFLITCYILNNFNLFFTMYE